MFTFLSLPRVLYIAGYGRSGSTLIDIILGNSEEILSLGEICRLFSYWTDRQHQCTCGQPLPSCELWQESFLAHVNLSDLESSRSRIEGLTSLPRLLTYRFKERDVKIYRSAHQSLFNHLREQTGKSIIVDSSKSSRPMVGRFLALSRLADLDVYVLHLIRNGLDTMQSLLIKGSNRLLEGQEISPTSSLLPAPVGWVSANFWTSVLAGFMPENRYLRLRYEDFISNTGDSLRKIGAFVGFDPQPLVEKIENRVDFAVGHMVSGNRIRLHKRIRIQNRLTDPPGKHLGWHQRAIFKLIAGGLNHYYGY